MYKICLLEDEVNLNNILSDYLTKEGYIVDKYFDGETLLENIDKDYKLFILDIMLPGISGFDVFKEIKKVNQLAPIIFISARDSDIDKIMGLEMGSDDYISKPFYPKELVVRVNNILKRVYKNLDDTKLTYQNYNIDIKKRLVYDNLNLIDMTTLEYDLLLYFINNSGIALSRELILENVWGVDYFGSDRVVDDLIRRLRKKMSTLNIETIYGYGYRLV